MVRQGFDQKRRGTGRSGGHQERRQEARRTGTRRLVLHTTFSNRRQPSSNGLRPFPAGPASRFVFLDDDEDEEDEDDDAENADDQQTGEPADSENQQAVPQTAEGEQEIETDETDDDFTLAWEALSVAAKIYESESSEESKRKLADVYMLMGDCCLEDDNSTQAIDTFKKALELKESYLEETNRELAEVHHLLGLAFEHDNLIDDAVAQVGKAKTVLQKRIDLLKNSTTASDAKGKGKASETQDKADEEIAELESLIVEIDAKVRGFAATSWSRIHN